MRSWLSLLLQIALLASCTAARTTTQSVPLCSPSDRAAAVTIRQRLADWVRATNGGDRVGANDIWARPMVGWFPAAPVFGDSAAFAAAGLPFQANAPSVTTYDLRVDAVDVSGQIAAVHDIWTERRTLPNGVVVQRIIRGSELWRCSADSKWRIARYVSAPEPWVRVP